MGQATFVNGEVALFAKLICQFINLTHNIHPFLGCHQVFIDTDTHQPGIRRGIVEELTIEGQVQKNCRSTVDLSLC